MEEERARRRVVRALVRVCSSVVYTQREPVAGLSRATSWTKRNETSCFFVRTSRGFRQELLPPCALAFYSVQQCLLVVHSKLAVQPSEAPASPLEAATLATPLPRAASLVKERRLTTAGMTTRQDLLLTTKEGQRRIKRPTREHTQIARASERVQSRGARGDERITGSRGMVETDNDDRRTRRGERDRMRRGESRSTRCVCRGGVGCGFCEGGERKRSRRLLGAG